MSTEEKQRLLLAFIMGACCSTMATTALVLHQDKKKNKTIKTIIRSQRNVMQWVADHALAIDREEFLKGYLEQISFYNIVIEETDD